VFEQWFRSHWQRVEIIDIPNANAYDGVMLRLFFTLVSASFPSGVGANLPAASAEASDERGRQFVVEITNAVWFTWPS
jgi:hypothetical protein